MIDSIEETLDVGFGYIAHFASLNHSPHSIHHLMLAAARSIPIAAV
jgi:hypothetical protein